MSLAFYKIKCNRRSIFFLRTHIMKWSLGRLGRLLRCLGLPLGPLGLLDVGRLRLHWTTRNFGPLRYPLLIASEPMSRMAVRVELLEGVKMGLSLLGCVGVVALVELVELVVLVLLVLLVAWQKVI